MTKDEALKLALEALKSLVQPDNCEHGYWWEDCPNDECEKVKDMKAITAIKEALAKPDDLDVWKVRALQAEAVIEKFMAQPEQEPVAWVSTTELLVMRGNALGGAKDWRINLGLVKQDGDVGLYTTPPQRIWVGLTDEDDIYWEDGGTLRDLVKAIEAKLKEKNYVIR